MLVVCSELVLSFGEQPLGAIDAGQCPCWPSWDLATMDMAGNGLATGESSNPSIQRNIFFFICRTSIKVGENIYIYFIFWLAHNWEVFGIVIGTLHSLLFTESLLSVPPHKQAKLIVWLRSVWSFAGKLHRIHSQSPRDPRLPPATIRTSGPWRLQEKVSPKTRPGARAFNLFQDIKRRMLFVLTYW